MNKLFEAVASSTKETIVQARNWFVGHFEELIGIIYIVLPYVLIKSHIGALESIVVTLVVVFILNFVTKVKHRLKNETKEGFPISEYRYTVKDADGIVSIKEHDTQEAILYLCDVEDYLRRKGLI